MNGDNRSNEMPHFGSPIVGRERDLAMLQSLVEDPTVTLITVIGIGGVGKTRLVTEAARLLTNGNVLFVPLASIDSPELVLPEIANALELHSDRPGEVIRSWLEDWQGVLVLDNFEQVVEAAPDIAAIIPKHGRVKVLITSQQPLQIESEHIVRLRALGVPDINSPITELADSPSVRMLLNIAAHHDATFAEAALAGERAQTIAEICRRLDGVPLALELAAPRLTSLSPEAVLHQMDLGKQILTSQRRDLPERQRTMHSAIAWSVRLLPTDTQRAFTWLGVFTAGFDLPQVERLVEHLDLDISAIDVISELMNFSLIRRREAGTQPWYSLLTAIREYCLAELDATGERDAAEQFVADHVRALGEQSEEALTNAGADAWAEMLERELPTIRTAVRWSLDHEEPELPLVLADGIWRFMEQYGASNELRDWIAQAETWPEKASPRIRAAALLTRLLLENERRDLDAGYKTGETIAQILSTHNYPDLQVRFDIYMGHMAKDANHIDEAFALYSRALAQTTTPEMSRWAAVAEGSLGAISYVRGDFAAAEASWTNVARIMEARNDQITLAGVYTNLMAAANDQEAYDRSLAYADKAIAIIRSLDLKRELLYALLNQAYAYLDLGEADQARINLEEALEIAHSIDSPLLLATAYTNLTSVHLANDAFAAASESALKALALLTLDEGSAQYLTLSGVLVSALMQQSRLEDAAALLGKTLSYSEEVAYTFSQRRSHDLAEMWITIQERCERAEEYRQRGATWNASTWLRNLEWFARSIAPIATPGMLISIPPDGDLAQLTRREEEVLQLLINGHSTQEMAVQLSVSPRTVTTHLAHIMNKMNVSSRTELLAAVLRSRQ
ncbi:MAG: hypothetical protein KC435_04585 [Thermomicrobiales bacterium]|nr:hypothetical protein [Thermomicrobiales bacterium]